MNRSYRIIPVYTGDVSGAASALFELGGMVVIHDPSGCNSTYNTHDETRWYDMDSLIYITGFTQTDAIMGDDEKLIREVEEAAAELSPAFIALTSSPIPYMNGTDFPAIARLIEQDTGIPSFYVSANGMHDYICGAGNAFLYLAKKMFREKTNEKKRRAVNLLGVTPLEFAAEGSVESLRRILTEAGWTIQSCWAMGDTLDQLRTAQEADVNLVVSATGYSLAKYLETTAGIPYVAGIPVGEFRDRLLETLEKSARDGVSRIPYLDRGAFKCQEPDGGTEYPNRSNCSSCQDKCSDEDHFPVKPGEDAVSERREKEVICMIGEPVTMGSLAAAVTLETGKSVQVLCPLETDPSLIGPTDRMVDGEEETEEALRNASLVIADPLYRPVCREETFFYDLPHQAFSGRCCRKTMKNMMELTGAELISDAVSV